MKKKKTKSRYKDKEFLKAISIRLKQLRQENGETQESFYANTDINISRLELGDYDFNMSTLKRICEYFRLSPEKFFKDIN